MCKILYLNRSSLRLLLVTVGYIGIVVLAGTLPVMAQERVLEVWTHEFPPLQKGMTQKWIPEFEAKNPGIKVKLTAIPFAGVVSFDAKLLAALSGGEGPDFWDMGDWNYKTFIDNKFLAPFDPKIFGYTSDQEMIEAYLPGTMDIFIRDGKVYGLFSEYNTLALFYNLDMFDKEGIPPLPTDKPVSWKQIEEIGAKLRKTDPSGKLTQIGYQFGFFASFRSPQWYAQNFYALMRQYGQDDLYIDGKPAAYTEPVKKALQTIYDFTHTSKAYDPTFLTNWFADFPKGRVAMVLAGTWFVPAIKQNNPNVRFGVAPHPVVNPEDKATYKNIQWSWGWSVNANKPPEQQRLAQEFIAFMLGKKGETEQATWWFSNLGYTQPSRAFLESKAYADKLAADPWLKQWVDAFKMYEIKYVPHSYDEPGAALMRAIDRVVYDKMSPEESAKLLQAELQRLQ
ncbi:MAG TPA: extracellular solute-binding protein [Candidatus Limnocylindrales bacterium]|nr:extracellular solute-binding protein [Candidatus Limnocylindrales bacterium]